MKAKKSSIRTNTMFIKGYFLVGVNLQTWGISANCLCKEGAEEGEAVEHLPCSAQDWSKTEGLEKIADVNIVTLRNFAQRNI